MTIVTFQSFPGGVDDSAVKSWPVSGHVTANASGGPNSKPYGHYAASGSTTNGDGNIRVHDWDTVAKYPMIQPGQTSWRHIAIRVPSGQTNTDTSLFAGDEVHQTSSFGTTGPAPVNLSHDGVGNRWYYIARGANNQGLAGQSFNQTVFGRASTSNGTLVNFTGGTRTVVANRWTYWLVGTSWSYTGLGWVEIWYADDTNTTWTNIVPRYSNIYTCYNNGNFPMSSLYASLADGSGTRALDFSNGFYGDNYTEALAQANSVNGFSVAATPVNTAVPTITGTAQEDQTLTGVAGTWTNTPTLTYQWEWDQTTGTWTSVGGATGSTFLCAATYVGAQVRLREIANGTINAYSAPVTIAAAGGATVTRFRLSIVRSATARTINPAGRIPGLGGGGV